MRQLKAMQTVIMSIKIVLVFLFYPPKIDCFLEKAYWFRNHDFLKIKLKKITYFIIAFFPMTFFWIYDKSGFIKQALKTLNVNSQWIISFINFSLVLITVLIILIIVLFIYVSHFMLKHKNRDNTGDGSRS